MISTNTIIFYRENAEQLTDWFCSVAKKYSSEQYLVDLFKLKKQKEINPKGLYTKIINLHPYFVLKNLRQFCKDLMLFDETDTESIDWLNSIMIQMFVTARINGEIVTIDADVLESFAIGGGWLNKEDKYAGKNRMYELCDIIGLPIVDYIKTDNQIKERLKDLMRLIYRTKIYNCYGCQDPIYKAIILTLLTVAVSQNKNKFLECTSHLNKKFKQLTLEEIAIGCVKANILKPFNQEEIATLTNLQDTENVTTETKSDDTNSHIPYSIVSKLIRELSDIPADDFPEWFENRNFKFLDHRVATRSFQPKYYNENNSKRFWLC